MKAIQILFIMLIFAIQGAFQPANAQVSYEFATTLPPEAMPVKSVASNLFGSYKTGNSDIRYVFDEHGITIISTIYSSISRETIRESSKYKVENDLLYGVQEKPVPCVLDGDSYYFGLRSESVICGSSSSNQLTRISEMVYILNFFENGRYTPCLLTFKGKELTIQYFTYENETTLFNGIKLQSTDTGNGIQTIVLQPTLAEWNSFNRSLLFGDKTSFKREKENKF